nr:MAG TPA: hypothetical protein [Caudoviricetes sp.]
MPNPAPCGVFLCPLNRGNYKRLRARVHTAAHHPREQNHVPH